MTDRSGAEPPPEVDTVLAACDGLLGEVGRREHRFSWLRSPGSDRDTWLPVDAYYPGRRLVVVCSPERSPYRQVYRELIPSHGLRLLQLEGGMLPAEETSLRATLRARIAALGSSPPPRAEPPAPQPETHEREAHERLVANAVASLVRPLAAPAAQPRRITRSQAAAAERAARLLAARRSSRETGRSAAAPGRARQQLGRPRQRPPAAARRARPGTSSAAVLQPPSLLIGMALAIALCLEVYAAVAVALNSGQLLLAAGIVLDGCARTLGTLAAIRLGRQDWAWGCVVVGSPAVAMFAFFQDSGPVEIEPAPLAGLVSLPALALIAIGGLGWLLGV